MPVKIDFGIFFLVMKMTETQSKSIFFLTFCWNMRGLEYEGGRGDKGGGGKGERGSAGRVVNENASKST